MKLSMNQAIFLVIILTISLINADRSQFEPSSVAIQQHADLIHEMMDSYSVGRKLVLPIPNWILNRNLMIRIEQRTE